MLLRESVIELQAGSVLDDRYQIRRVVGKGATGVVLEADDRVSRELVALKVFKREIATDERWQEIVGSELRHGRLLQHPNVCRIFDARDVGGYRFLIMEFASEGSLRNQLREGAADRPMADRIADARAVVSGLAAIHAAGIIHRDVKPDNVLRMKDGRLVVTDFGLAVTPGQTTFVSGYSGAVGTPSYMAPEVAMGGDATMASDVYSLGVILHEIFFDRRPEWDTTKRGRFLRWPVTRKSSRVARAMARVCADCLEQLAPRRPRDAGEVRVRFERAVLGRTGSLLEAVGTRRGALILSALGATAAAGVVYLAARPADLSVTAKISGTAADLTVGARRILQREGQVRCLFPGSDHKTARVVWHRPALGEVIDLGSGVTRPWPLPPELIASGCPQWNVEGGAVAFVGGSGSSDLKVSDTPDGKNARTLTTGHQPRWLLGGRNLAFAIGRQRLGITDMSGFSQMLSESAAPNETIFGMAVRPDGALAVLFRDLIVGRSAVVTYRPPSWSIESRVEIPANVMRIFALDPKGPVSLVMDEGAEQVLATLREGGELVRQGRVPGALINDVLDLPDRRLVVALERSATVSVSGPGGEERELLVANDFDRADVSADGKVIVMSLLLADGRWVIVAYDRGSDQLRRLTDGPWDRDPMLTGDAKQFIFLEGRERRRTRACSLEAPSSCRTVSGDPSASALMGNSPSGTQLAYLSQQGPQYRLKLTSLQGIAEDNLDLGPAVTRCRVRWTQTDRLWLFDRSADSAAWVEIKLPAGSPTGRREPAGIPGPEGCPQTPAESALKVRRRATTTIYGMDRSLATPAAPGDDR